MTENIINKAIDSLMAIDNETQSKLKCHNYELKYHGKLKYYNGNIRKLNNNVKISLSQNWKNVDEDIVAGIIHTLLIKLLKLNIKFTENTQLYNSFIKNISIAAEKNNVNSFLKVYFDDLNNKYFYGLIDTPNLITKTMKRNKFGYYNYISDTICINTILMKDAELLKYVLYHEMLHKSLKFKNKGLKNYYHTSEFRDYEKRYPNSKLLEMQLKKLSRSWL